MGCSVVGALGRQADPRTLTDLQETFRRAKDRGPDSAGLWLRPWDPAGLAVEAYSTGGEDPTWPAVPPGGFTLVANRRGEPTTEYVRDKRETDVQPFTSPSGTWVYSHNGVVPNDFQIYEQALPPGHTPPTRIDSYAIGVALDRWGWPEALAKLGGGSFALIVATPNEPQVLRYATNYKPLAYRGSSTAVQLASLEGYLDHHHDPLADPGVQRIGPYTFGEFSLGPDGRAFVHTSRSLFELHPDLQVDAKRVLVICSGGLDSSTVAWKYFTDGWEVSLLHFLWGEKAQDSEVAAVRRLATAMYGDRADEHLYLVETDFFRRWAPSALTDPEIKIHKERGGEAGAEFAHEWVNARNFKFLAEATGIAEGHGFPYIAIGVNLEEAGAYPDNEGIFGIRINEVLPYAVKGYCRVRLLQPFAGYMKHHIVRDGLAIGMPYELTWSCYESGLAHCGSCGPCMMRKTAFAMNGASDPVFAVA
jgi:7-cyano-7-deazaguanine synthase